MILTREEFSSKPIWLNVFKPSGYSSAKVVAIVKRFTKAKKVGHGGTLDPFAVGVLPIALNKATKTSQQVMDGVKTYRFVITWGEFRDSDDIDGNITEKSDLRPSANAVSLILPFFIGKIKQMPSKFSAIKVNGKRAYELARKNIDFNLGFRDIEIFSLSLVNFNNKNAQFIVKCSKGTYVRSLARDICEKLSVCGYVSELSREKVAEFSIENTILLDQLKIKLHYGGSFLEGSMFSYEKSNS